MARMVSGWPRGRLRTVVMALVKQREAAVPNLRRVTRVTSGPWAQPHLSAVPSRPRHRGAAGRTPDRYFAVVASGGVPAGSLRWWVACSYAWPIPRRVGSL
ncbi:hypothetical protein GCM10009780_58240 [Actinomadura alba]